MTEENGMGTAIDAVQSVSQGAYTAPEQASEKMLPQSQVDEIVKRAKANAVDQYKKLYSEQPDYARQKYGDAAPVYQAQPQQNSAPQFDENAYRKIAAEEAQRMRDDIYSQAQKKQQEEYAQRIVQNFYQKVSAAKDSYEDFDKVTGDINLQAFPNTVQLLAEHVENSGDLLYEFGKDRFKLSQIEQLATYSPNDAIAQAQRLSAAVKERKAAQAASVNNPRDPLSQMQPNISGKTSNAHDWKELSRQWVA